MEGRIIEGEKDERTKLLFLAASACIGITFFFWLNLTNVFFETIRGRQLFSRAVFWLAVYQFAAFVTIYYKEVFRHLQKFFTTTAHPLNLAIVRIVVFYFYVTFSGDKILMYSQFPRELLFPPYGLENIVSILPYSLNISQPLIILFKITSFFAMIGLWTRFSSFITVVLAVYLMGLTQLFGKINHFHFIIWFGFILSMSPCSDTFSVDAVMRSARSLKTKALGKLSPSWSYGLPLVFIWILFGILYFFAGHSKWYAAVGYDWVFTENLKNIMYYKWMEFNGWSPAFRIDHYPFLIKTTALATIIFEYGFIFCILFKYSRTVAAISGIIFHGMSGFFMRISFLSLQQCYVAFFNWHRIFSFLGEKIHNSKGTVYYDPQTLPMRILLSILFHCNIFVTENYVPLHMAGASIKEKRQAFVYMQNGKDMAVGLGAIRHVCVRNILLLPVWVVTFILPLKAALLHKGGVTVRSTPASVQACFANSIGVVIIGTLFIAGNTYCGIRMIDTWPVTSFILFNGVMYNPVVSSIDMEILDKNGQKIAYDKFSFYKKFGTATFRGMLQSIVRNSNKEIREKQFEALWRVLTKLDGKFQEAHQIKFYRILNRIVSPELQHINPIERRLMHVLQVKSK